MSEDKMLGDFERWAQSPNGNYLDAEGAWKACSAIKDAEIANLVNAEAEAMALVLSHEGHIEKLNAKIASRDLTIKELREAVQHAQKQPYPFGHLELFEKALAKSEHHNSRALDKMLLEARIEEVKKFELGIISNVQEYKTFLALKLAELNKE